MVERQAFGGTGHRRPAADTRVRVSDAGRRTIDRSGYFCLSNGRGARSLRTMVPHGDTSDTIPGAGFALPVRRSLTDVRGRN